jgi:hypothetical protein
MTFLKDNGGRQVLVDLHYSQTQAHSGEMHRIRQRCRSVLSCQALPRTVFNKKLRAKRRVASELEVGSPFVPVRELLLRK